MLRGWLPVHLPLRGDPRIRPGHDPASGRWVKAPPAAGPVILAEANPLTPAAAIRRRGPGLLRLPKHPEPTATRAITPRPRTLPHPAPIVPFQKRLIRMSLMSSYLNDWRCLVGLDSRVIELVLIATLHHPRGLHAVRSSSLKSRETAHSSRTHGGDVRCECHIVPTRVPHWRTGAHVRVSSYWLGSAANAS
jgi:hypothetical protein